MMTKTKRHWKTRSIAIAAAACAVIAPAARAATYTWTGGANDGVWQTGASETNWDGGSYSPGNGGGNDFVFDTDTTPDPTLQGGHNPNASTLTINSPSLDIHIDASNGNTHLDFNPASSGSQTLDVVSGNHTIDTVNTGLGGYINLQGNDINTWRVSGSAVLTIDAEIRGSTVNRAFTKRGGGTLILTNANNSYGGAVTAGDGDLQITSIADTGVNSAIGNGAGTSTITISRVNTSGGLTYTGSADASTNRALFLQRYDLATQGSAGNAGSARLESASAALTLTGGIATDTDTGTSGAANIAFSIGGDGDINVNNTGISGYADVTKFGSGTLTLAAANTYTGDTTVSAGRLIDTGSVASNQVTVASGAAVGGSGMITNNLTLDAGANFVFDTAFTNASALTVAGTFTWDSGFGVANLVAADGSAVDWSSVADGVYTLLNTSATFNASNITNFGLANAYDIAPGRIAFFSQGSLDLNIQTVSSVPTPAALPAGLGLLAALGLRRRKR